MRKIIVSEMMSIDGFFAGPNGNIDWHRVDEEFNGYAIDLLNTVDTIMLGRVTYDLFRSYWPAALTDPKTSENDLVIAKSIDDAHKVVFSKSGFASDWKNTAVRTAIAPEEIAKMKSAPGKDIVIYGSGTIVAALAPLGLIDEYRFFVNPVILGSGRTLFEGVAQPIGLKLDGTKTFANGNVLLVYRPA